MGKIISFEFGSVSFCPTVCFCLRFTYFVCLFRSLSSCWLAVLSLLSVGACFAVLLSLLLRLSVRFCCAALCLVLFDFVGRFQGLVVRQFCAALYFRHCMRICIFIFSWSVCSEHCSLTFYFRALCVGFLRISYTFLYFPRESWGSIGNPKLLVTSSVVRVFCRQCL